MGIRHIQFWASLYLLREGDLVTSEKKSVFLGDEDEFAESADGGLQEWIKDLKKLGLKEYGWKYLTTP